MTNKKTEKKQAATPVDISDVSYRIPTWRYSMVLVVFACLIVVVAGRLGYLHLYKQSFLVAQGEQRMVRDVEVPGLRGRILDRHGEPLALSSPVYSIYINPQRFSADNIKPLASILGLNHGKLKKRFRKNANQSFMYIKRQLAPELANQVLDKKWKGIAAETEFRRFYPAAEVTSHIVGMTNIDGNGQEGLELAYDEWLQGKSGGRRVVKDLLGNVIKQLNVTEVEEAGQDLKLTLDLRLQYLAYRELKAAVQTHKANWGSAVLLDAQNGDVLALVNRPSYNPNNRRQLTAEAMRNRALTDIVEPGSTMKPFTVAAALDSGKYTPGTVLNTSPGYMRIKHKTIRDHRDYGKLTLTKVITKSSNIGVTKIAHNLGADSLWGLLHQAHLGEVTGIGFPGEAAGQLPYPQQLDKLGLATLSYGYGLSVTPLQLAQAYTTFANQGCLQQVRLINGQAQENCEQILPKKYARQVASMLETVTQKGGTGTRAKVEGYRVGGKTGTAHKVGREGYEDSEYSAVFAGIAPISDPRFVLVVVIDQPQGQEYYGGEVAAPVFSRIMKSALRTLNIAPDKVQDFHVAEVSS